MGAPNFVDEVKGSLNAPLSLKEKIGFGCGDFACNLYFMFFTLYGLYFYTDVFGISAALVGTIFLVARIWDAVNDPLMGIIADRTESKWGHFRPYILYMSVPFGVFGFFCFFIPDVSDSSKIIYMAVTYVLFGMIYTAVNLPYSGLMGVISPSPIERTKISVFRFVGANAGGLVVALSVPLILGLFAKSNEGEGYLYTAGMFSVMSVILLCITFSTTRERILSPPRKLSHLSADIKGLFLNAPAVSLFFVSMFFMCSISVHLASVPYLFKYYVVPEYTLFIWDLSTEGMIGLLFSLFTIFNLLGVVVTTAVVKRIGKILAFNIFMVASCCLWSLQYFLDENEVFLLFVLEAIAALVQGPTSAILFAMFTDAADYSEWKRGARATGLVMAFSSFGMKFGWALGGALGGWILASYGYIANQDQASETVVGIKLMFTWVPAVIGWVSCVVLILNPLKEHVLNIMVQDLQGSRMQESRG